MDKSILVIDKPKSCSNCRFCQYSYEGMRICAAEDTSDHGVHTSIEENYYSDIKPNWCPLKPAPNKLVTHLFGENQIVSMQKEDAPVYVAGYENGWNDCLDRIQGEEE